MSRPAFACRQAPADRQDRFHHPRVNESSFPDPKRLPSTNARSARAERARHRTCGFACRRPASDALSPLQMLSHEGARSSTVVTGYSPEVVSDHAPFVDFCNRNEMRAQPADRPSPAHRAEVALCAAFIAGGQRPFQSSASRDFRGQGLSWLTHINLSSARSLAMGALPQPDQLGHLLSQPCFHRRPEEPPPEMSPAMRVIHRVAKPGHASAKPG